MENKITVQKLTIKDKDILDRAFKYYSLISTLNNIPLTKREIQLVAFTAVKGNISYSENKQEFCKLYNSSNSTIHNMIAKLKKYTILIKESGKIKVNPKILINFNDNDIYLQIRITNV